MSSLLDVVEKLTTTVDELKNRVGELERGEALALDQAITWTGKHTFDRALGVASANGVEFLFDNTGTPAGPVNQSAMLVDLTSDLDDASGPPAIYGVYTDIKQIGTYDLLSLIGNYTKASFGSSGTCSDARALFVEIENDGGGTITTAYGLYIGAVEGSTEYGIYQSDASNLNYFAGNVSMAKLLDLSAATAGQIKFPASQNASADAHTLDDYEEGAWTATFVATTSGTITINANVGRYTKVGRLVTLHGTFSVTSVSSPVGVWQLTGLPFTSATGGPTESAVAVLPSTLNASAATQMVAYVVGNSTQINIYHFATGTLTGAAADVKAGTVLVINVTYMV